VLVAADGREAFPVDGTFVQRQLLPKWLLPALAALLVVAIALVTLWFTVLKPAVRSAAREAAVEQNKDIIQAAQQAGGAAGEAQKNADQAKQNSEKAMQAAGLDPADPGAGPANPVKPVAGTAAGDPTDFRVAADAAIVADPKRFTEFAYTMPDPAKTLVVTDLVFQNPRGDTGTVRLLRDANGKKSVLLEVGLANFRDLDHHWLQAWRFLPGEKVVVAVSCQNPGDRGNCTPSVSFSGRTEG